MKTYRTKEVADGIGIHANTVRLYEEWGLIPPVARKENGYRIFTDYHIDQLILARTALQVEVLQNGLRNKVVGIVKQSARGEFDGALTVTADYRKQIDKEMLRAEEALEIAGRMLSGGEIARSGDMKRKEVSEYLEISMDTLRNWELNGLLTIKRKQNGYRIYTGADLLRLKVIRALRCANYSLTAILRMLNKLSRDPGTDIRAAINTPGPDEDIVTACDNLITSLQAAALNAEQMDRQIRTMKEKYQDSSSHALS